LPQADRRRKVRVRRDDEAGPLRFEAREIAEGANLVGAGFEIQQQDVLAFDRALDAGDQHYAAVGGVRREAREIELLLVQRNREGPVSEGRRAVDQIERCIWDAVDRVVRGVCVELDLQHVAELQFRNRAERSRSAGFLLNR
jgi:hypothetical protein